jgi:mannose-6-phosphate isomerase
MSDSSDLYPYVLAPTMTTQIWGGDALVKTYGQPGNPNGKYGESWECWDTDAVVNGPLAGKTVADLRACLGPALMGDVDASRIFPILTKIIDARDWLSVQVHPDDAYAQRVEHQPFGKTECWFIFHAQPGSQLVLGWTHDTDRAEYQRRVADGSLGDILRKVEVKAGQTFYLPAGSLHAIGAGIVLFETQQASDLTYRIFDWNRNGPDGKPRELNIQKAGDVLNYHQGRSGALDEIEYTFDGLSRTALIADPRFTVERVVATREPASIPTENRPLIVMPLGKPLDVVCEGGNATLQPYQTAIVPAGAAWARICTNAGDEAPFMLVTPPPTPQSLAVRLLAAGIDQTRVDNFTAQFSLSP